MSPLPGASKLVGEAIAYPFQDWRFVLSRILPIYLVAFGFMIGSLVLLAVAARDIRADDPEAPLFGPLLWPSLLAFLLYLAVSWFLGVKALRLLFGRIWDGGAPVSLLTLDGYDISMLVAAVKLTVAFIAVCVAALVGSVLIGLAIVLPLGLTDSSGTVDPPSLGFILAMALVYLLTLISYAAGICWLGGRLSTFYARAVRGEGTSLRQAFRDTRGHTWTLFKSFLLFGLLYAGFIIPASLISSILSALTPDGADALQRLEWTMSLEYGFGYYTPDWPQQYAMLLVSLAAALVLVSALTRYATLVYDALVTGDQETPE